MSKEIMDIEFDVEIMDSGKVVLVDFWAPWCSPCIMQWPILEKLESEYNGKIKFLKVNVDESQSSAVKYSIMSIPTLLIFKDGQPINQVIGLTSESNLRAVLDEALQ
jgi:thioredoxin 1